MGFHRLNWIFIFFLIFVESEAQDDYVSVEQNKAYFEISETDCHRFIQRSKRRIDKLTERLKKTNDLYLRQFTKFEDKLFQQLCELNESCAEAMIHDAWLSFNRFENLCAKEGTQNPKIVIGNLDTLEQVINYLRQKNLNTGMARDNSDTEKDQCACAGIEALNESKKRLNFELKRSELLGKYIGDRTGFMNRVLENSSYQLNPLSKINESLFYYKSELKENISLFSDCTNIESNIINHYRQIERCSMNESNLTATNQGGRADIPDKISIDDLLKKAPIETLAIMANLSSSEIQKVKDIRDFLIESKASSDRLSNDTTQIVSSAKSYLDPNDQSSKDGLAESKKNTAADKSDWKPNPLKTKRIIDRFSYGANFQANRRNILFPLGGSLTGQLSFQVAKSFNIGLGTSWIVGFMNGRQMSGGFGEMPELKSFGTAGIGFRSFMDIRISRAIFLTSSGELNYKLSNDRETAVSVTNFLDRIRMNNPNSGLFFGLKIQYPSRSLSSPTLEILYNVLHERTDQPEIVLRAGINIKRKHSFRQ